MPPSSEQGFQGLRHHIAQGLSRRSRQSPQPSGQTHRELHRKDNLLFGYGQLALGSLGLFDVTVCLLLGNPVAPNQDVRHLSVGIAFLEQVQGGVDALRELGG